MQRARVKRKSCEKNRSAGTENGWWHFCEMNGDNLVKSTINDMNVNWTYAIVVVYFAMMVENWPSNPYPPHNLPTPLPLRFVYFAPPTPQFFYRNKAKGISRHITWIKKNKVILFFSINKMVHIFYQMINNIKSHLIWSETPEVSTSFIHFIVTKESFLKTMSPPTLPSS